MANASSSASSSSLKARISLQDPIDPAERLEGTPIVVAAFSSGAEFLAHYSDDGPAGELALVTRARPRTRAELVIEVNWPGLPNPVFVRAHVSRRRLGVVRGCTRTRRRRATFSSPWHAAMPSAITCAGSGATACGCRSAGAPSAACS